MLSGPSPSLWSLKRPWFSDPETSGPGAAGGEPVPTRLQLAPGWVGAGGVSAALVLPSIPQPRGFQRGAGGQGRRRRSGEGLRRLAGRPPPRPNVGEAGGCWGWSPFLRRDPERVGGPPRVTQRVRSEASPDAHRHTTPPPHTVQSLHLPAEVTPVAHRGSPKGKVWGGAAVPCAGHWRAHLGAARRGSPRTARRSGPAPSTAPRLAADPVGCAQPCERWALWRRHRQRPARGSRTRSAPHAAAPPAGEARSAPAPRG